MVQAAAHAPMFGSIRITQVTDAELHQFADLIYRRTGIRISPQKKLLLSNRLRRLLAIRASRTSAVTTGISGGSATAIPNGTRSCKGHDPRLTCSATTCNGIGFAACSWSSAPPRAAKANASLAANLVGRVRISGDESVTAAASPPACLTSCGGKSTSSVRISASAAGTGQEAVFGQRAMRLALREVSPPLLREVKDGQTWALCPSSPTCSPSDSTT